MPIQPVISNTSPLIGLLGLNCLPLLRDLYTEVWIPREVEKEFLVVDETFYREVLNKAPWIIVDSTINFTSKLSEGTPILDYQSFRRDSEIAPTEYM